MYNDLQNKHHKGELGKIKSVSVGYGGYQNCLFGVSFNFESGWWEASDFISAGWYNDIKPNKRSAWTEADRSADKITFCDTLQQIMNDAKVTKVEELNGKPVRVFFQDGCLKTWEILTEVL